MQLSEVLRLFDSPLSQEQCWSLCHEACKTLVKKRWEDRQRKERIKYILSLDSLILTQRGEIEILHSEPNFQDIQKDSELVFAIGNLICRCLDHGLDEIEICEVRFQDDLAELIGGMVLQSNEFDEGIGDTDSLNESWESRKFYAHQHRSFSTLLEVIRFCEARLLRRNIERKKHYTNVCKALYIEASELKAFLGHVLHDFVEENPVSLDDLKGPELAKKFVKDWAMLWLKVMNELRNKTNQRRQEADGEETPEHYQTTPFDIMNSSTERSIKTVLKRSDSLPDNAEDKILNFLKSRVSSQEDMVEHETSNPGEQLKNTDNTDSAVKPLKKLSVEVPLSDSIDNWEQYTLDDTLEEDYLNGSYISDDDDDDDDYDDDEKCVYPADTHTSHQHHPSHSTENKKTKNPVEHLDIEFLPDISLNSQVSYSRRFTHSGESIKNNRKTKSDMNLHQIDIDDDQEDETSKIGSSLTEIFKIRQEITRSELEMTNSNDVKNGKTCFGCQKNKFSFFTRSRLCTVCQRKYCLKCMRENTVVSPEVANAAPVNIDINYTGNPSPLLSSSQRFSTSMFNLSKRKNREDQFSWIRNRMPNGVLIHMCVGCETFLKSIEHEKSKQKWTVQLELDL